MPPELIKAHKANDLAVMKAYGMPIKETDEAACVAWLMRLYQEKVEEKQSWMHSAMSLRWWQFARRRPIYHPLEKRWLETLIFHNQFRPEQRHFAVERRKCHSSETKCDTGNQNIIHHNALLANSYSTFHWYFTRTILYETKKYAILSLNSVIADLNSAFVDFYLL